MDFMIEELNSANRLCTSCGMCCDGTLFQFVNVGIEDRERAIATGLELHDRRGDSSFDQPCRFFCNSECGIYEKRPPVCVDFRCSLLKKIDCGEIPLDEAYAKVRAVRALQMSLEKFCPDAKSMPLSANEVFKIRCLIDENDLAQRQQNAMFMLLANKFIEIVREYFWAKPKIEPNDDSSASANAQ
jgi:Fe-S-cluster containining protein